MKLIAEAPEKADENLENAAQRAWRDFQVEQISQEEEPYA